MEKFPFIHFNVVDPIRSDPDPKDHTGSESENKSDTLDIKIILVHLYFKALGQIRL